MYFKRKTLIYSVLIGLSITLLSSLITNNTVIGEFPDITFVSIPMLGVSYWGYPLPWMKLIIYPGEVKEPIWIHFIIDIVYWTVLILVIKTLYGSVKRWMKKPEDLKPVDLPLPEAEASKSKKSKKKRKKKSRKSKRKKK